MTPRKEVLVTGAIKIASFLLLGSQAFAGFCESDVSRESLIQGHAENELLARPAVNITVGQREADIVGNDNRAIQAAVDYVGQLGGGLVEVMPGTYLLRDSVHMRSKVTLRGAGPTTVLRKAPEAYSLLAADGDFGERAVTVADPTGFEVGFGVHIRSKKVGAFHTVCATILNKRGNYLTLSRPLNADCMMADDAHAVTIFPAISADDTEGVRIEDIVVDGNRKENRRIDGCRGGGIFFYQAHGGTIDRCTVRDYAGDGISFQNSHDVQVLNTLIEGCDGAGIHPGSGSQRAVVRGCTSERNDRDGFFFCWRVRNAVVEDNVFRDNGATGISIGHKDTDNLIRHNRIEGNRGGGVHWRDEAEPMAAHNITFEENTVRNNGTFGLSIEGATNGTVIRGNTIECEDPEGVGVHIGPKAGSIVFESNRIRAIHEISDSRSLERRGKQEGS